MANNNDIIPIDQLPDDDGGDVIPVAQLPADEQNPVIQAAQQVGQSFMDAGKEVARGYESGVANTLDNADALAQGVGDATGMGSSGTFGEIAQVFHDRAAAIPETSVHPVLKAAYNMVGQAPSALAEFTLAKAAIPLTGTQSALATMMGNTPKAMRTAGALTDTAALMVQGAVNEYRASGRDITRVVPGALNAATIGLALPAGGEAISMVKNAGVGAGKAFIEFVTGNAKLADDFVNNMWRYNTNPFGQVKNPQEITKLNQQKLFELKRESQTSEFDLVTKQTQEKHELEAGLTEAMSGVRESNRIAKEAAADGRTSSLAKVVEQGQQTLAKTREAIDANLYGHFTHAVEYLSKKRNDLGNMVKESIVNVVNKDPGATVKRGPLISTFKQVLDENGFLLKEGAVVPKAGGALEKETTQTLQGLYDDIVTHFDHPTHPTGVTVGYLQELKSKVQDVAYDGQPSYSKNILKQLAGALKPEKFADDIIGRDIGNELSQLKAANKDFSSFKSRYDEAVDLLTSKDAQGQPVADTKRMTNAMKAGDRKTQVLLAKADGALPDNLKIRPQLDKTMRASSEAETLYTSKVKNTRRVLSQEKRNLDRKIRIKESEIRQADSEKKFVKSQALRDQLNKFKKQEEDVFLVIETAMKNDEEFLTQQKSLRQVFASGRAGGVQVGAGMGAVAGGINAARTGDPVTAGISIASSMFGGALSPTVASNLVKGANVAGNVANPGLSVLSNLLKSRLARAIAVKESRPD